MWIAAKAPSLAEMEAMAHDIFDRLPAAFRALCEGVVLRVDDFPADDVLDELNADSEFDLLGLFQGVGLPFRSEQDVDTDAQHDLALPPADPGLLGRT